MIEGLLFLIADQWIGIRLVNGLVLATEKPLYKPIPYMLLYCIYYVHVYFLCIMTSRWPVELHYYCIYESI